MSRYLDPKADVVFKKIFGEHPHILISFLNAVLPLAEDNEIVELSYLPTEQIPPIPEFKRTIADVKCTDVKGRIFVVEMQMNWTDYFKQRLLFGTSQAVVKQLEKGEDYQFMQPVYGLGLVAEIYERQSADWYHHYQLVKKGTNDSEVIEHLQLIFIELPKFPIHSPKEKKLRLLWLRFLREIDEKTRHVATELLEIPEIAQAIELAEESAYTPGELEYYQSYWDNVSREKTLMSGHYAKGKAEGMVKGIAKGIAKGLAKGMAEGIAKGIEKSQQDIVYNALAQGIDVQIISKITGLSVDIVQKIGNVLKEKR